MPPARFDDFGRAITPKVEQGTQIGAVYPKPRRFSYRRLGTESDAQTGRPDHVRVVRPVAHRRRGVGPQARAGDPGR